MAEDPTSFDSSQDQDSKASEHVVRNVATNPESGKAPVRSCLVAVLVAIALLSGAWHWFVENNREAHRLRRNFSVMRDIQLATDYYRTEYNRFPDFTSSAVPEDAVLRSRGSWLAALLGIEKSINPRKIQFLDEPRAKGGTNGLLQDQDEWVLVDRWGEPFYVVFDTNLDNRIADPEDPSKVLSKAVIIYSSGPDCDPKTWEDNVRSWK